MAEFDHEIELRKEPLRVKVGDDIYEFEPELDSEVFISAFERLQEAQGETQNGEVSPERLRATLEASRDYLGSLMRPESRERFLESPPPNRVLGEMTRWVMEQHGGGRPTGPSNASAGGQPKTGRRSTGSARSQASTRGGGR